VNAEFERTTHTAVEMAQADAGEERPVQHAQFGSGPLLQRDYVLVIAGAGCSAEEALRQLLRDFPSYSPESLARFWRLEEGHGPLRVGDRMGIDLAGYGYCEVTITDVGSNTITMRTVEGHAEAGRISFAVTEDPAGRLVARIRSRARARSRLLYLGHSAVGKYIQSGIWIGFLNALAERCGGRPLGEVIVETADVEETAADRGLIELPTIHARHGECEARL
jgi:hypothetical protein